ncbi:MAG: hypothetical protein EA373_02090 [Oceanospirillales bacterium]|nr:MAG: hypothetical protein EA373_02090 [Oceanospirillales bacterium]
MNYKHAIVKVEGSVATLLCNGCGVELSQGTTHEDRQHFCTMCMSGNCKAKFKHEILKDSKSNASHSKTCA